MSAMRVNEVVITIPVGGSEYPNRDLVRNLEEAWKAAKLAIIEGYVLLPHRTTVLTNNGGQSYEITFVLAKFPAEEYPQKQE